MALCVLELADHAQIAKGWMERMDDGICVCYLPRKVIHRPPIKWQHMITVNVREYSANVHMWGSW